VAGATQMYGLGRAVRAAVRTAASRGAIGGAETSRGFAGEIVSSLGLAGAADVHAPLLVRIAAQRTRRDVPEWKEVVVPDSRRSSP